MNPLALLKYAPWALAALAAVAALWFKAEADHCQASFATYKEEQAKAIAAQMLKDRELSNRLLNEQRESLNRLHEQSLSSIKAIQNAPVTSTCGPTLRDASRGVRALIQPGQPPARP
jgi:hypothetical protein